MEINNYRTLVASEGKVLTDGKDIISEVIYLGKYDSPDNYYEIDKPQDEEITEIVGSELDKAISDKIAEIKKYDKSTESFSLNGLGIWITPTQRQDILRFLAAITSQGMPQDSEIEYPYEGMAIKAKIKDIYALVYAIDYYAAMTMAVTNKHIAAVKALTDVKEVENYNYRVGYPEKLTIKL